MMGFLTKKMIIPLVLVSILFSYTSCNKTTANRDGIVNSERQKLESEVRDMIFPLPLEMSVYEGKFIFDTNTSIVIPEKESSSDGFLAGLIFNELVDRYQQSVGIVRKASLSSEDKSILVGDLNNPFVKSFCKNNGVLDELKSLGEEGYILSVTEKNIVVAANTSKGALYGLESLRQIIVLNDLVLSVPHLLVKDKPKFAFRGIKLYLPGRNNVIFFKRFIKDFVAKYKFNTIILELNANMRLQSHPELNTGTVEFEKHLNFSRLGRPPGLHQEYQNSSHQDNADGDILEKEEVAELISYMRKFNIDVIPELPSLTHSYYLLFGHEDLAENHEQPYPDTYCPLKPEIYNIYFDVLEEYIEVIHPDIIHVGHDEWRMEKDLCELCRGKDYGQLYVDDIVKIHDFLKNKGIKTAIWGDHLLESVTQKDFRIWKSSAGYEYKIPGALRPEQVSESIPKDILIFNWFWDEINNDRQVSDFGFKQVYGNLRPDIENWNERYSIQNVLGGAPSSWAATTENNIGKDQLLDFLGCSNLLWSEHYLTMDELSFLTEPMIGQIYSDLSGRVLPSNAGSVITPVDIASDFNSTLSNDFNGLKNKTLKTGSLKVGNIVFDLGTSGDRKAVSVTSSKGVSFPNSATGIKIKSDPNSIIFLHACAREGNNKKAYDEIYNFDETAQLLGWYEIVYEDGFIETIPLRYGMNILDFKWRQRILNNEIPKAKYSQNRYAYQAKAVDCAAEGSEPLTFFAYEWENVRFGKLIKEINLKAVNHYGSEGNSIILLAISVTDNKKASEAEGIERQ